LIRKNKRAKVRKGKIKTPINDFKASFLALKLKKAYVTLKKGSINIVPTA
jgi:hypothetical protein